NKFCGDGLIGLRYAVLATILYVQSLTMVAAGGLAASNAYGFVNTVRAGLDLLNAAKGTAREAAWKAAGTRLSSVFFRPEFIE
ncbi:hypothetical protein, partial [Pseudomonas helleri]|uniref:hypothetical protein n=1 Tax=Pseudomonas helleri TaxID=1608996 RepID=UPI001885DDE6